MNTAEVRNDILDDLYLVGKSKSLGYLPLHTLENLCGVSVEEIKTFANQNNLKYLILKNGECDIHSGAVYVFDDSMLSNILMENRAVLKNAGVPTENAIDYILFISNNTISSYKYPDAYAAIGKTFNDQRFR